MGRINSFIKKLGPGLLFAGTAIGVSHLVQSTKAGAEFGFGLTWALLIAILLKYPFFKFAPKYSIATNESVLHGYKKLHPIIPIIFFIINLLNFLYKGNRSVFSKTKSKKFFFSFCEAK